MKTGTITGTYGSGKTKCDIFTYEERGGTWYAVNGSTVANFTHEELYEGVNVEELADSDTLNWSEPIRSEEDLETAVEDGGVSDYEEDEEEDAFEQYDDGEYDVDAMRTDAANGNFSEDRAEEYRHEHIVQESIANGQFEQARKQCERYGLIYEQQMIAAGRDPWR